MGTGWMVYGLLIVAGLAPWLVFPALLHGWDGLWFGMSVVGVLAVLGWMIMCADARRKR